MTYACRWAVKYTIGLFIRAIHPTDSLEGFIAGGTTFPKSQRANTRFPAERRDFTRRIRNLSYKRNIIEGKRDNKNVLSKRRQKLVTFDSLIEKVSLSLSSFLLSFSLFFCRSFSFTHSHSFTFSPSLSLTFSLANPALFYFSPLFGRVVFGLNICMSRVSLNVMSSIFNFERKFLIERKLRKMMHRVCVSYEEAAESYRRSRKNTLSDVCTSKVE